MFSNVLLIHAKSGVDGRIGVYLTNALLNTIHNIINNIGINCMKEWIQWEEYPFRRLEWELS